jgi:excisionase family DNA binding protein
LELKNTSEIIKSEKPIEKRGNSEPSLALYKEEELKTVQWVADDLKLSEVTIYKYIKQGKIHAIKVGDKYRVPVSQFKI